MGEDVVGVERVAEGVGSDTVVAEVAGLSALEIGGLNARKLAWEAGKGR